MQTNLMIGVILMGLGLISAQNTTCANPLQVGSFNTLQINFAPYRDRRLEATIDYLNTVQDLSILCLQELWDSNQRQEVISGLQGRYPSAHYASPVQSTCSGGCSRSEIDDLRRCIDRSDCSLFSGEFRECVADNCRGQLEGYGAPCVTCLQSGDSIGDIFRNLDDCFSSDTPSNQSTCFAYEGQSDNLLLSTQPFDATDVLYFSESPITVTTALYGRLNTAIGTTHVFCTHLLPADLPVFTFENRTNYNQSIELLEWIDSKVGNSTSDVVMILGDFNHGPNYWPDNYDFVVSQGYVDAYIQAGNRNCTYCDSNPLAMGDTSMIIDHIYLRGAQQLSSSRFATYDQYNLEAINIPFIDYNRIPISDHYGVRASVCAGESSQPGILASQVSVRDDDRFPERDDRSSASTIFFSIALLSVLSLSL